MPFGPFSTWEANKSICRVGHEFAIDLELVPDFGKSKREVSPSEEVWPELLPLEADWKKAQDVEVHYERSGTTLKLLVGEHLKQRSGWIELVPLLTKLENLQRSEQWVSFGFTRSHLSLHQKIILHIHKPIVIVVLSFVTCCTRYIHSWMVRNLNACVYQVISCIYTKFLIFSSRLFKLLPPSHSSSFDACCEKGNPNIIQNLTKLKNFNRV